MAAVFLGVLIWHKGSKRVGIVEGESDERLKVRYLTRNGYSLETARRCQNTIRASHVNVRPVSVNLRSVEVL